jgi:hypothetical protein
LTVADWDSFKGCLEVQLNLDLEAIDVAFLEPLRDLKAWWDRQSENTKRYINWFTGGIGGASLTAFLARILGTTASALATACAEALGATIVGVALGLFIAALVDCGIDQVTV